MCQGPVIQWNRCPDQAIDSSRQRDDRRMPIEKNKAAEYRHQAALCLEVAERMSANKDCKRMAHMAREWLALAEEIEADKD